MYTPSHGEMNPVSFPVVIVGQDMRSKKLVSVHKTDMRGVREESVVERRVHFLQYSTQSGSDSVHDGVDMFPAIVSNRSIIASRTSASASI